MCKVSNCFSKPVSYYEGNEITATAFKPFKNNLSTFQALKFFPRENQKAFLKDLQNSSVDRKKSYSSQWHCI